MVWGGSKPSLPQILGLERQVFPHDLGWFKATFSTDSWP